MTKDLSMSTPTPVVGPSPRKDEQQELAEFAAVPALEVHPAGDWSDAFPGIFAASHAEGSLTEADAEELLVSFDERGRRPEDLARLRDFIDATRAAWTLSALTRYEQILGAREGAFARAEDALTAAPPEGSFSAEATATTVDALLAGEFPPQAFGRALRDIRDRHFEGDTRRMEKKAGPAFADLPRFVAGMAIPKTYRDVLAIAAAFEQADAEGLVNAWLSDAYRRYVRHDPGRIFPTDGASSPRRRAAEILIYATALKLGRIPYAYFDGFSYHLGAAVARDAISAGFDAEVVIATIAEYAATQEGFFDEVHARAMRLARMHHPDLASLLLRMGAHRAREAGDWGFASILMAEAADLLKDLARIRPGLKEYVRTEQLALYEQALEDQAAFREVLGRSDDAEGSDHFVELLSRKIEDLRSGNGRRRPRVLFLPEVSRQLGAGSWFAHGEAWRLYETMPKVIVKPRRTKGAGGTTGGAATGSPVSQGAAPVSNAPASGSSASGTMMAKATIRRFTGVVDVPDFAAGLLAAMPESRRRVVEDFKSSAPGLWAHIEQAGRFDLVDAAFAAIGRRSQAVPYAAFSVALTSLAGRAGFVPEEPTVLEPIGADLISQSRWEFGGFQVPLAIPGSSPLLIK